MKTADEDKMLTFGRPCSRSAMLKQAQHYSHLIATLTCSSQAYDKGQVRVIVGKLCSYELDDSPADACQPFQLAH